MMLCFNMPNFLKGPVLEEMAKNEGYQNWDVHFKVIFKMNQLVETLSFKIYNVQLTH